jgi:hypothetical protein
VVDLRQESAVARVQRKGMTHGLSALDLGRVVRVVGVDSEREDESTAPVHACHSVS